MTRERPDSGPPAALTLRAPAKVNLFLEVTARRPDGYHELRTLLVAVSLFDVLTKRIPVAAGLGGGSSDAATALIGLNRLWKLGLSRDELAGLAAELGSDVAFFLHVPVAWCTGRGEVVTPWPIGRRL